MSKAIHTYRCIRALSIEPSLVNLVNYGMDDDMYIIIGTVYNESTIMWDAYRECLEIVAYIIDYCIIDSNHPYVVDSL